MTAANGEIQWFIARDGKQYGPVSDAEMKKLVELRHLKPADLVWRPGFPEWRQAQAVFPPAPQPPQPKLTTQPPPAAAQPQPAPAPQPVPAPAPQPQAAPQPVVVQPAPQPQHHQPAQQPQQQPYQPKPQPAPQHPAFQPQPFQAQPQHFQPHPAPEPVRPESVHHESAPQPVMQPQGPAPSQWPEPAGLRGEPPVGGRMPTEPYEPRHPAAGGHAHGPAGGPMGAPAPMQPAPAPVQFQPNRAAYEPRRPAAHPAPAPQAPILAPPGAAAPRGPQPGPSLAPQPIAADPIAAARSRSIAASAHGDEPEEASAPPRRRRLGKTLAAAVAVLLIAAGAGYYLANGGGGGIKAVMTAATKSGDKAAPLDNLSETSEALDAHFQRAPMWVIVKKEFPDWYGERLKEAAKLSADKTPEDKIAQHLVEKLVGLRRQYSDQALAASTPKLKSVANAFLGNLKALAAKSTDACYSFISQGETSPAVIAMMRSSEQSTAIQAQVAAIFEAIADGRKAPVQHSAPIKTDYDALADQLTKLGWSQTDLQLFADSKALAKAPPEKVCRMVQDWFSAHISIQDGEIQERLLVETLRPVVAG